MVSITQIKFDGGALGALATTKPSLNWLLEGDENDWIQAKYEINIQYDDGFTEYFEVESSDSAHIEWPGRPLNSKESVAVQVRVTGVDNSQSFWSDKFTIQTGDLQWQTPFIVQVDQDATTHEDKISPEILFRSPVFTLNKEVKRATVFSTALGVYEVEINGQKISDAILEPGWTSYNHRLLHQVYDVTSLISKTNVVAGRVAAGWFSGFLGFDGGASNIYGTEKALSLQLDILFEDGSTQSISTSSDWKSTTGPIVNAQLYCGETFDATREIEGWSIPGLDITTWSAVVEIKHRSKRIIPKSFGYTKVIEVLKPKELIFTPKGHYVLDLGQNVVGFLHMNRVNGQKGHTVVFKHAEVLEDGELGTRPLRAAKAIDEYIFKGDIDGEEYTPRFTFHGCRYVQIENYPSELTLSSFEFRVIGSEMESVGAFECSDPLINRLYQNVFNSTRGNFVSIPSDCPQRDERMGWLGDIAVFAPTALYMFDSYNFLKSWLEDLKYEQEENGGFPAVVVPDVIKAYDTPWNGAYAAIWQDASVIVPWRLYEATRNTDVLDAQYDSMKMWYEFLPKIPGKIRWDKVKIQLGDWLDPTAPPDDPLKAVTDPYLVADAFLYLILKQLVRAAEVLRKKEDLKYFQRCKQKAKQDFKEQYISEEGKLFCETQTAYALVVVFGLHDSDEQVKIAGERLSMLVASNGYKIGTGFAGTPFITEALVLSGHVSDAYKMLLQKECPSWLYPVSMGATTIWERWDSMLPSGKVNPGEMTSFNHYALGSVAMWLHERVGGIKMLKPAFEEVLLKPFVGGGLTFASTKHRSPYGWIESSWTQLGNKFDYKVKVPLNTTAIVELPNGEKYRTGSGSYEYECVI
jgi:alpha-L-rhamnosidase